MNFTCVDVLPSLLNRTKVQVIKPAFYKNLPKELKEDNEVSSYSDIKKLALKYGRIEQDGKTFVFPIKPPRFKNAEEMFNYLDKQYDLSKPKEFFVYRWVWIK